MECTQRLVSLRSPLGGEIAAIIRSRVGGVMQMGGWERWVVHSNLHAALGARMETCIVLLPVPAQLLTQLIPSPALRAHAPVVVSRTRSTRCSSTSGSRRR